MNKKSILRSLLLFAIIAILPVFVAYRSIGNVIEEQYLATIEDLTRDLKQQIARLEHVSTAEYQIRDFFVTMMEKKLCRQKPEIIKKFVNSVEKAYPNAFKWIFLDENFDIIPIGQNQLGMSRYWRNSLKGGFYVFNVLKDTSAKKDHKSTLEEYLKSIPFLQKALGDETKVEHVFELPNKPEKAKWLKKDCYIIWGADGQTFSSHGAIDKIYGACALMVIPEFLPENFWYKRIILGRKKSTDNFNFFISAVDISNNKAFEIAPELPNDKDFAEGLIKSYTNRSQDIFMYKNYIVGSTPPKSQSEIRLLSMADISNANRHRIQMKLLLRLSCIFIILISSIPFILIKRAGFAHLSLRQRIVALFILSMGLPLMSMISLGKTFISREESRLKESAFVKMRAVIETLGLRYTDTPRLIEVTLYNKLKSLLPKDSKDWNVKSVKEAMEKAVNSGEIAKYALVCEKSIVATNWVDMPEAMNKLIVVMARQALKTDRSSEVKEGANLIKDALDEEINTIFNKALGDSNAFLRPSHLRHFFYVDQHLYFMHIRVSINGVNHPLFIYMPDSLVEKNFAAHEFATNKFAANEESRILIPELSFYATLPGLESFPAESPTWNRLGEVLNQSAYLNIEESGIINIENEDFLYVTKPISSMHTKSYQPCLLTSKKPITKRLNEVGILLFFLSGVAIIGSILLSLLLSSSLLDPIKKIDSAAQQIGKGNLDVNLPEEGKDELGRLSFTFNEMVKGLREREKMQAYVSDSVLEAVKDRSDSSVHAGKNMEATILFSDIRNFTGISEANSPNKVFEVLNEFFGGVEPIIRKNYGRVDKYIGDAVMAIFHQTSPEHHALSAIKAAIKMKEFVVLMNRERQKKGFFPIEIGIGISTGTVLLGDVGSSRRKDLTVIGDEVNLASRLESASKQGKHWKIIFSGQTFKCIEDFVEADKMPFEEIRGKKNAVQIYEFVRFKYPTLD